MGASPTAANNARLPRWGNSTYQKWAQGLGVEMIRMSMYLYCYVITQQVKMMKPNIHPEYRTVVFHDTSVDEYFKIGSTIKTDREIELDGVTYPYVTIDVSSKSHPFYTGKLRTVASEGNVARFTQRFGRFVSTKKGSWWKFLTLCVPQKNAIQTVRLWSEKDGYMWFVNLIHVLRPFRVVRKNLDSKFDGLTIFVWLIIRSD